MDCSVLETFKMVTADFQVEDKANKPRFFEKAFLVANIKFEIILEILFLKLNNANVLFSKEILISKTYITNKVQLTIEQV